MSDLILLRHGESQWNRAHRFTGSVDVPLSERGKAEAWAAGAKFRGRRIDTVHTSMLIRATETARIALKAAGIGPLPTARDPALNERGYGVLEGLEKDEVARRFGAAELRRWRTSFDGRPPGGESLADALARVGPYWTRHILVDLRAGQNVLVVAHGNSLRVLLMRLERLTPAQVVDLKIPTGTPVLYEITPEGTVGAKRYF